VGGGNGDPMDSLELTSVQRKDPETAAREAELFKQAGEYAEQNPFTARYGATTPGFTGMQMAAQDYLSRAVLGPGYNDYNVNFSNYQAPTPGTGATAQPPQWAWQNPEAVVPTQPTLPPSVPGPPPPGQYNPVEPPSTLGPDPTNPDPADPPPIGAQPPVDPTPTPPAAPVKPDDDLMRVLGPNTPTRIEQRDGSVIIRYPDGSEEIEEAEFSPASVLNAAVAQPQTSAPDPALTALRIPDYTTMPVPSGPTKPDYTTMPVKPDIGPTMPPIPPDNVPLPPPAGPPLEGPEPVGVGMRQMQTAEEATRQMLQNRAMTEAQAGSIFDDPRDISQYMNTLGVQSEIESAEQDYQRALNQAQARQAAAGAFGSRASVQDAGLAADQLRNIAAIRGAGYERAAARMDQAAQDRTAVNLANLQARGQFRGQRAALADQLSGLGRRRQAATFDAAQQLSQAGREQQLTQLQQQAFDYEQWLRSQEGGAQTLGFLRSMMPGAQEFTYGQKPDRLSQILGLASVGAGAYAASDANSKENIKPVGKKNGFNIYEFNYIGQPTRWRGVIAQEVQETRPDAVAERNGVLSVNYDKIGLKMEMV